MKKNLYIEAAKYYDLSFSGGDNARRVEFITKTLKRFKVKTVLELGCGTGLFLIPLKKKGFDIEGLDLSPSMLKEARKKDKSVRYYKKDMSSFKIAKKYDAIICLSSSLVILPGYGAIEKTLRNSYKHLGNEGILLLDLPNHEKEIREEHNTRERETHKFPGGRLDSVYFSYKKGNRWVEEWDGTVIKGKKVTKFKDVWEELVFSPRKMEGIIRKGGFKILRLYGSMKGGKFDRHGSRRRVYLCRKELR
jgi:SAM-dependent methyltransferase